MIQTILPEEMWIPNYQHQPQHTYILLASLNLGGAEKIVSDQLWANYYSKFPRKITLIVIYDKEKEHSIPPNVNIVRLNNNIKNGEYLFNQIVYENKPLVCHLINDIAAQYLFSKNLDLHLVIHNDKRGWSNSIEVLNHPQIVTLIAVCNYVKLQLEEVSHKPVFTFRHHISNHQLSFNPDIRKKLRTQIGIAEDTILIGMTGRISQQKNYFLALDTLYHLKHNQPEKNYKLIILGGVAPNFKELYIRLINKINILQLHKDVILTGFRTDAYAWINCFDIALNTSYFEGLSMATQEFMQNGLQVVLSNVCGQKEIYDDEKQLHFFDLPVELDTPLTERFHLRLNVENLEEHADLYIQYQNLVYNIAKLINENYKERIVFSQETIKNLNNLAYGSHNIWHLLNSINVFKKPLEEKPAFLTSNLMLGGAQRSLINLLTEFKNNDYDIPLILLNQSNNTQFYNEILEKYIKHYLCHTSKDVFDICPNLFQYVFENKITKLILWNVDSKIKLLLDKFLGKFISIVDVSPGDYCFVEMDNEKVFQEAIYHYNTDFYNNLSSFVSKYHNEESKYKLLSLENKTHIIPNGVPINDNNFYLPKDKTPFKFVVCGRIAPSKHLDVIFTAFKNFLINNPNAELYIYGSAESYYLEYYNELMVHYKNLINDKKIIFMGHHDYPQAILKNYHALIVLGTHQGSPNIVLEAAACKLPVIANDSGGTKEIINNDTGILLPAIPNVEPLIEAMENLYTNYDLHLKKADNCFELIQKNFSMVKMYKQYLKVLYNDK